MPNLLGTNFDLSGTKYINKFKENRKLYFSLTVAVIFIFLSLIYLGPFGGLEDLGLIGQKKTDQGVEAGDVVRGVSGDGWADVIIGTRDFTDVLSRGYVNEKWLDRPGGVVVDRDTAGSNLGYLYAQSTRENRIIALNLDNCIPSNVTCAGEKVFGQPAITDHSACNRDSSYQHFPVYSPPNENTLCFVREDALSTAENLSFIGMFTGGGNLYVPDTQNHRVLVYYDAWNDQTADEVIGQSNFTSRYCNKDENVEPGTYQDTSPTNSSLCLLDLLDTAKHGSGVALDDEGNLWVADNGNNRVLRFPKGTDGKILKSADIVLGQTNFTIGPASIGSGLDQLSNPNSLRFDPDGNLYVSDFGNQRIMKYTPVQLVTGGSGTNFANKVGYVGEIDLLNGGIWIITGGTQHDEVWLELYRFDGVIIKSLPVSQALSGSLGVTKVGSLVVNSYSQGVFYVSDPLNKETLGSYGDRELFDYQSVINGSRFSNATHGVAIVGNKLFVSDTCRILGWDNPTGLNNGQPADIVLVQPNFNQNNCNINSIASLKSDSDNRLWAKTRRGVYVYDANNISSIGTEPVYIISDPIPVLGGGFTNVLNDYEGLWGLTPQKIDDKLFLWVSNREDNRVVRIRDPLTNPIVDVVLGQTSITEKSCNMDQLSQNSDDPKPDLSMICKPGGLSVDNFGNLYVSDHALEVDGNFRLLMFSNTMFPIDNTSVIYAPAATKEFPELGGQNHATWEPAFSSQNIMVAGYNGYVGGRFVGYYLDPTDPNSNQPDGYLKDYYSGPFGAAFDNYDNLYITDISRPRVMIYKDPFDSQILPPSPISEPSPFPSPSPTPLDSQPPSAPQSLFASAVSSSQINISWDASSDNVEVTGYDIFRDNSLISTVSVTNFGDTGLSPSSEYTYFVRARDAAGNISGDSNSASNTTHAGVQNGILTGQIKDSQTGGVLVGALINIKKSDSKGKSGLVVTTTSNSSGNFAASLVEGAYDIEVNMSGYNKQRANSLIVTNNNTVIVNFDLTPKGGGGSSKWGKGKNK